jgi:transcriptional regulator with XRE-family HTH domain
MRLTQMEVAKRLGLTQLDFSNLLRGDAALSMTFISQFCRQLHVDPKLVIPSLKQDAQDVPKVVYLESRMSVDGDIQRAYIEGNQVVVEYAHTVSH